MSHGLYIYRRMGGQIKWCVRLVPLPVPLARLNFDGLLLTVALSLGYYLPPSLPTSSQPFYLFRYVPPLATPPLVPALARIG